VLSVKRSKRLAILALYTSTKEIHSLLAQFGSTATLGKRTGFFIRSHPMTNYTELSDPAEEIVLPNGESYGKPRAICYLMIKEGK